MTGNRARKLYTDTERDIIRFMFNNGRTDKEIGEALGRQPRGVAGERQNMGLMRAHQPNFKANMTPEEDEILLTRTLDEAEQLIQRKTRKQLRRRRNHLRDQGRKPVTPARHDEENLAERGETQSDVAPLLREIASSLAAIADLIEQGQRDR